MLGYKSFQDDEELSKVFTELGLIYDDEVCKYEGDRLEPRVIVDNAAVFCHFIEATPHIEYVDSLGIQTTTDSKSVIKDIWNRRVWLMRDKLDRLKNLIDKI